jgi:hypothetical protein
MGPHGRRIRTVPRHQWLPCSGCPVRQDDRDVVCPSLVAALLGFYGGESWDSVYAAAG